MSPYVHKKARRQMAKKIRQHMPKRVRQTRKKTEKHRLPKRVARTKLKRLSEQNKKSARRLLAKELLRKQRLTAVNVEANLLIPVNEQLLGEAVVEARNLYLYASKQKDRDPAKTRYLLAKMTALCVARDVLYPEK